MNLKPWREIIIPHKDVREGSFQQSEFAADLSQVAAGTASDEYKNCEKFYRRTFITEGMGLLLQSVAKRISGKGGDPVIQLQTAFGGGKTHTLLAVYHLAKRDVSPEKLSGIPSILDKIGIIELPKSQVAVIDGVRMSPSQPRKYGSILVNTLWGELAWQLGGESAYRLVESADKDGVSPGKETFAQILRQHAPCVVLMDELVAFIRQFENGKTYPAGTFESNLSFVQALTEAMKMVPNAILLASLPESELEVGGDRGKQALDALEKYFARVESVWKPVATEEAFEIVKRRLFDGDGNHGEAERSCRAFADYYISNNTKFPSETLASQYYERLIQSYPIHPEIFDRLYNDWSTLEKFQRTRGVLQYLAIVIHRLWNSENREPMIMPGSIPLEDVNVRTKNVHYLPQGWEPVIESEVDGARSLPVDIDTKEPKFGAIQAARRVARTIFLGTAPRNASQTAKGLQIENILLGVAIPGQVVGTYEDALRRLLDKCQHLYPGNGRYWFDTRPTLRREMEARKERFNFQHDVLPAIKDYASKSLRGTSCFSGVHIFATSADVPDEQNGGPRLVVLDPSNGCAYSKANSTTVFDAALEILQKRGLQPRQRQNRLIFLASDADSAGRLRENAKTYLAWASIAADIDEERINLDVAQIKQAREALGTAEKVLSQSVRESFKWILNPYSDQSARTSDQLKWEAASINTNTGGILTSIEAKLRDEEWLIFEWSPIHLSNLLNQYYFKESATDVIVRRLIADMASYIYMPRLANEDVLRSAIEQGIMSVDFFGYAQGKEGSRYLGLCFGAPGKALVDDRSLLVFRATASAQMSLANLSPSGTIPTDQTVRPSVAGSTASGVNASNSPKKSIRFFATKDLNPQKARMDFGQIVEEVLLQLASRLDTSVRISVEIEAEDPNGFDESAQRTLKENCNALGFTQVDFSGN
jgi:predicted AAA+ superfamily ATPase